MREPGGLRVRPFSHGPSVRPVPGSTALARGLLTPAVPFGRSFRLDLAYPELMLAIEYNGREHLSPERADDDLVREQLIVAAGWRVIRFRAGW